MAEFLTALSVAVATVTWLLTHFRDRHARLVAHTADIIANLSTSDRLAESSFGVTKLINSNSRVTMAGIDPKVEGHVVDILDYYEFICDLCATGAVSRKTILDLRGRLMKRTWEVCEPYIMETRAAQRRQIYSGFERFVNSLPFND